MVVTVVSFALNRLRLARGGVVGVVPLRPVLIHQRARVVEQALRVGVAKEQACVRHLHAAVGVQLDVVEGYGHILIERVHADDKDTEHNIEERIVFDKVVCVGVHEARPTVSRCVLRVLHAVVGHCLV